MKDIILVLLACTLFLSIMLTVGFGFDVKQLEAEKEKHRLNEIALMEQVAQQEALLEEAKRIIEEKQTEIEIYKGLLNGSIQILLTPKEKEPR